MGDGTRIGGPPSSPQPVTTNPSDLETTETSASIAENKPLPDTQVEAKSTTAFKQTGADAKAQKNYAGGSKQKELSENLAAPPRIIQAGDNPVELSKINVQRDTLNEGAINRYPNGVTMQRDKDSTVSMTRLQAPPGGSVESSNGQLIARDSKGKEAARLDKDGTLHVKTKHGEYTESPDGKVKFETREKGNPGDLRKPGRIPANNYEDYGISTGRTTIRFPNGIEFDKTTRKITVPDEYAGSFREDKHYVGPRTGYANGRELYKVEKDGLYIRTPDGTFKVGANDEISYEPNKR